MRAIIRRKLDQARQRPQSPLPSPIQFDFDSPILTVAEVAERLRLSPTTVRERFGRAAGVIRMGRAIRIPRAVVEREIQRFVER